MNKKVSWSTRQLYVAALATLAALALSACGGGGGAGGGSAVSASPGANPPAPAGTTITGSVGDGPVTDARITATDRDGKVIGNATSDGQARFTLALPADARYPVTVKSSGGTDIVTSHAPDFDLQSIVNDASQSSANITPITTLIVRAANCRAGGLTAANLNAARQTVATRLSAGLDPQKVADPITTPVTVSNVAENVKANQVLAEIVTRTASTLQKKGRTITANEVLEALACDVADGELDGAAVSGGISEVSSVAQAAIAAVLTEAIVNQLQVDGKDAHAALDAAIHRVLPEAPATVSIDAVEVTAQLVTETRIAVGAALPLQPDPTLVTLAEALESLATPAKPAAVLAALPADAAGGANTLLAAARTAPDATIASVGANISYGGGRGTPTLTLTAAASEVVSGGTTTITWATTNARSCVGLKGLTGALPANGSQTTPPITQATTFTLACLSSTGSVTRSVVVNLPTPTVTLVAEQTSVNRNDRTSLRWTSNRVTACTASGAWDGTRGLSGSESVGPIVAESRFVLTCTGSLGAVSQTATVRIAPPTLTLAAEQVSVALGAAPTLQWSTQNADGCTASGAWTGAQPAAGRATLPSIVAGATYTLSCAGPSGNIAKSVTVSIAAPTLTLTAPSASINVGGSATLSWHAANAIACTASGAWTGAQPVDGANIAISGLNTNSTFNLTCTGPGGSITRSVDVRISVPTVTLTASQTSIDAGDSPTLSWTSTNATACTATGAWSGARATAASAAVGAVNASASYSLECTGPGGTSPRSTVAISVRPSVTLTASSPLVAPNTTVTLRWNSLGGGTCVAASPDARFNGTVAASGTVVTNPLPVDRTFTLTCSNPAGQAIASTTVITRGTTVRWTPPTTMNDGTPIRALRAFNVYFGSRPGEYEQVVEVLDPRATQQVIALSVGTWYVTVTAVAEILDDASQVELRESDYGNEVQKAVQ